MKLIPFKKSDIENINAIYQEAFPKEERFPLDFLLQNLGDIARLEVLKEDDVVLGFVYLLIKDDLVHIFFLAIAKDYRGKGLGGEILENIKKKYANMRIFLALEPLDDKAINFAQRKKRSQFYARHGFRRIDMQISERGILFDVMSTSEVRAYEYDDMVLMWCGDKAKEYYQMHAI